MASPNEAANTTAPWFDIPESEVMSIEHPCIVKNRAKAIEMLGGTQQMAQILERGTDQTLALTFNPKDPSSKTILSLHHETTNILLKVTVPKRTGRKRKRGSNEEFMEDDSGRSVDKDVSKLLTGLQQDGKASTVEAVGSIRSTHVWRSIPDFVYYTKPSRFLANIESQILPQQYPLLKEWTLPQTYGLEDTETIPPPVLSTQSLAHNYTYRQNPAVKTLEDPATGNKTLYNTSAPLRLHITSCMFDDPEYPTKPKVGCPPLHEQTPMIQHLVEHLRACFAERPLWTRRALTNRMPTDIPVHLIRNAAGYVAFNIRSGPWRDTYCALGIDPRSDPKYRIYQTILLKLVPKDRISMQARGGPPQRVWTRSADTESHIFTGTKPAPADGSVWQMCDLRDPQLKTLVNVPELHIRAQCEIRYFGWYANGTNAKLRVLLKAKIDALAEGNEVNTSTAELFMRLPENWTPRTKTSSDTTPDLINGYLPDNDDTRGMEWATAYRSICRTAAGSVPLSGSSGKGRISKPKPTARPSYIERADSVHDTEALDVEEDLEAEREAQIAAEYTEPEDGDDALLAENDDFADENVQA